MSITVAATRESANLEKMGEMARLFFLLIRNVAFLFSVVSYSQTRQKPNRLAGEAKMGTILGPLDDRQITIFDH